MYEVLKNSLLRFWTASIRRQLMLGIALVHAVMMTIFIVDLVQRQQNFLLTQNVEQANSLAESLAANSTSWVLANDVVGLEEVTLSQSGYPGLRYAMVLSLRGRVLAHTDPRNVGMYVGDDISKSLLGKPPGIQLLVNSDDIVDTAAPVLANDKLVAWARVGLDRSDIATGKAIVLRDGVLYTIAAILVGTVFAVLMARGLSFGLHRLVSVADRVSNGDLSVTVDLKRHDELGRLADDMNIMLRTLHRQSRAQTMLEKELRASGERLEEQVQERTHELKQARDVALQANRAKSAFLANVSHELRTPLNSILGFTGIIRDGMAGAINAEQKKQLEMVYANAEHLLELINDVLDISRVETGKLAIMKKDVPLASLVSRLEETMRQQFQAKGLAFIVDCPEQDRILCADIARLGQVLLNLLGNALKFTERGSVTLRIWFDDSTLLFEVEDTGIGISEDNLARVFEPFQQIDHMENRRYYGVGLGLSISRHLLALMGGELTVSSQLGQGSRFRGSLPGAGSPCPGQ